eukprot:TRINITY_DN4541_c0_g1_i1.p1 TRINITY_DN4541_c0_g1~~TRINITY_DN4541_c0_g1_i1.p1  ORF type:complete len:131 (+),score=13.15 TRINITY_DN4541_c0_g1_i1:13-405(+)
MNQQAFDIKTRKEKYELLLQDITAKEVLNLNECKLTDLLRNYIDGADKTLSRESELKEILDSKVIKKDDCSRVKALMRQVNSFQRKLGEADVELIDNRIGYGTIGQHQARGIVECGLFDRLFPSRIMMST